MDYSESVYTDEEVIRLNVFFVCYIIEIIARQIHQRNKYVVNMMGEDEIAKKINDASFLHVNSSSRVANSWINEYNLKKGKFDITDVNSDSVDVIPPPDQMAKLYTRLILMTLDDENDYVKSLIKVYNHPMCKKIDDYSCGIFTEPVSVIIRTYFNSSELKVMDIPQNYTDTEKLFRPILELYFSKNIISEADSFRDYVKDEYYKLVKTKYSKISQSSADLLNIENTELHNLILEVIFLNLYEYLTVILQRLEGKGKKRENFFMLNTKTDEDYQKRLERFLKRVSRNEEKTIYSFINIYSEYFKSDKISNIFYVPKFLKAYKDVIFVSREKTNITDISSYYFDIAKALLYEEEIDFNNKKYMNDKALIKSYQIWQFSRSTISQVENIYDSIINPQQNTNGDKIAQLMFMEKLFGMCNISYMLEKDYTADQCRENLDTMHELKKLGYSRLHKLIIDKIDTSEIYECIHDYILPICKECIGICISNCFKSIFDNEGSLRKDYLEKIKFYRSKCLSELKNTEFLNPSVKCNITNKNLKDQQLTDLFKMMQGYDSKEYSYIKSLEFNSMADYDECDIYFTQATFVESEFKLYSDDYDFQHDGYIYNISAVGLTFDENIDCEYDSYIISELLDDFNPEVDPKTKRVIY